MAVADHPRLLLHEFLSLDLCKEFEFVHKSSSTVGYRSNVFSTTLSHLIATNCGHLIMPFVAIRERLKEKAEDFFGCEYELFIEFTGLISWTKGAHIGWHSDDNRPYLKQRDYAAVCYLNSHGKDFKGGFFHFQDGEPATVVPVAGDVLMYTADSRNIHSVDEITGGERLTLTLWFTRDSSHDEDSKLVTLFSERLLNHQAGDLDSYLPLPASSNMYWFSPESASHHQSGFDIRWARVHILGYNFISSDDKIYDSLSDSLCDPLELLIKPLRLSRADEIFDKEFVNSLHALQVVQFYYWKAPELKVTKGGKETKSVVSLIKLSQEKSDYLRSVFPTDHQLTETVLSHLSFEDGLPPFDWTNFSTAVTMWEAHSRRLQRELLTSIPYWKIHQSIFSVPSLGL